MDVKVYYQKLRQIEAEIAEGEVVVVSLETADGGKAGVKTEAPRAIAAKLIVEGRARLATEEEATAYRTAVVEAKRAADQLAAANKMQFAVLSEADLKLFRGQTRAQKS